MLPLAPPPTRPRHRHYCYYFYSVLYTQSLSFSNSCCTMLTSAPMLREVSGVQLCPAINQAAAQTLLLLRLLLLLLLLLRRRRRRQLLLLRRRRRLLLLLLYTQRLSISCCTMLTSAPSPEGGEWCPVRPRHQPGHGPDPDQHGLAGQTHGGSDGLAEA